MDACMPTENEKVFESSGIGKDEDRISNLPDAILHYILSFLPTVDIVRTSILSTRWKFLWTAVHNLDIEDAPPEFYYGTQNDDICFVDFVNRVLMLRDVSNIQRFRMSCSMECTASHINSWISAAVRRKVQDLDLKFNINQQFFLPHSLFSCDSVKILSLDMLYVLKTPTTVWLPSLKILYLHGILFKDEISTQLFFSGCPVLEELTVLEGAWLRLKTVNIYVPALKKLGMHYDAMCGDELHDSKINIYAANLTSFKYEGALSCEYCLYNLSSVVDAYVNATTLTDRLEEVGFRACKLLIGLLRVGILTLSNDTIQTLGHVGYLISHLPKFDRLKYLEVIGEFENNTFGILLALLQLFHKLEYFVISQGFDPNVEYDVNDWMSKPVPQCFISSLMEIKFLRFSGTEHELSLVSFLLKSSAVLKRMTIVCSKSLSADVEKQATIRDQVLMLPRGSANSVIRFC